MRYNIVNIKDQGRNKMAEQKIDEEEIKSQKQRIAHYYELGCKSGYGSAREACEHGCAELDDWTMGPEEWLCYDAGCRGAEMPHYVTGWRYGHLPSSGHSYNYADDYAEGGVSLMEVDGGDKTQNLISALYIGVDRPIVKVAGWLNTLKHGSDGEPLVFWAREIG